MTTPSVFLANFRTASPVAVALRAAVAQRLAALPRQAVALRLLLPVLLLRQVALPRQAVAAVSVAVAAAELPAPLL
jgi:hypothetical protein